MEHVDLAAAASASDWASVAPIGGANSPSTLRHRHTHTHTHTDTHAREYDPTDKASSCQNSRAR